MNSNQQQRVLGRILAQQQDLCDLVAFVATGATNNCVSGQGDCGTGPGGGYTAPGAPRWRDASDAL